MKKTIYQSKEEYSSPLMEVLYIRTESGFASSTQDEGWSLGGLDENDGGEW